MLMSQGCCPVCGGYARRFLDASGTMLRETYECPLHGAIDYGNHRISLQEWVAARTDGAIPPHPATPESEDPIEPIPAQVDA